MSVTSIKNNNSTSCEYETIGNFKFNVELRKKWQLLKVACIVNAMWIHPCMLQIEIYSRCTCQYDVIMITFDILKMQQKANRYVFKDKNVYCINNLRILNKYIRYPMNNRGIFAHFSKHLTRILLRKSVLRKIRTNNLD